MSTTNTCKVTMLVLLFFWAIVSDTLWPYNPVHAGASIDLDFTPLHPMLQWRHYVSAFCHTFCPVFRTFCAKYSSFAS